MHETTYSAVPMGLLAAWPDPRPCTHLNEDLPEARRPECRCYHHIRPEGEGNVLQ